MSAPKGALISVCIVAIATRRIEGSKDTTFIAMNICDWCGNETRLNLVGHCLRCQNIATHAMILAREVAILTQKGGIQLYIGIERTGQETALLSVKRWSPLEPLESADSVAEVLATSQ